VVNPANGQPIARLAKSGADATLRAIDSAADALPSWRAATAAERGSCLQRWHNVLSARTDELAETMTKECGKPLAESRAEIAAGLASVSWFAAEAERCGWLRLACGCQHTPATRAQFPLEKRGATISALIA